MAGAVLFLFMVLKGKARFSLLLRKEMLLTGAALTFGTFAALYWAEQYVSSGLAAVLSATGPMMILLMQTAFPAPKSSRLLPARLYHRLHRGPAAGAAQSGG